MIGSNISGMEYQILDQLKSDKKFILDTTENEIHKEIR